MSEVGRANRRHRVSASSNGVRGLEVGVVVPAHNEAAHLPGCLLAIEAARAQVQQQYADVTVQVVVVLDDCTDASAHIVEQARGVESVSVAVRRVGTARRVGADHLLRNRGREAARRVWLANTDADSRVPRDWLTGLLAHAANGADLVLGTVVPGPGLPTRIAASWHANHELREGHPHVFGANFGIRADAYCSLGGWPELATGEDEALAALAECDEGLHIVRTAASPVVTSTRLRGRAPSGFSSYLRGLVPLAGHSETLAGTDRVIT